MKQSLIYWILSYKTWLNAFKNIKNYRKKLAVSYTFYRPCKNKKISKTNVSKKSDKNLQSLWKIVLIRHWEKYKPASLHY